MLKKLSLRIRCRDARACSSSEPLSDSKWVLLQSRTPRHPGNAHRLTRWLLLNTMRSHVVKNPFIKFPAQLRLAKTPLAVPTSCDVQVGTSPVRLLRHYLHN